MFTPSSVDGRVRSEGALFRPRVMNKMQRRPARFEHPASTYTRPQGNYNRRGAWAGCFSMLVSPAVDSYWADCLRYMCSVEQRSDYRTSKANGNRSGSVALVVSQPHLPNVMSTVRGGGHKPRAVLTFISWEQRHRDLRRVLAQALHTHAHFADGYILNAIENDASEEMGEPLLWYPVGHLIREYHHGAMYPRDNRRWDKKVLGSHFTLLQDSYYEHTKLTLILDKGGGSGPPNEAPPRYSRNLLVLAYKSLEDSTDHGLLAGWVRWSGAWEAYSLLQERKLPVSNITFNTHTSYSSLPPSLPSSLSLYRSFHLPNHIPVSPSLSFSSLNAPTQAKSLPCPSFLPQYYLPTPNLLYIFSYSSPPSVLPPTPSTCPYPLYFLPYLHPPHPPIPPSNRYIREPSATPPRRPKDTFKYVVLLEVLTATGGQVQQLRAATQRLRVERWSGYTGLYTLHTLQDFAESFASNDSLNRMVADVV